MHCTMAQAKLEQDVELKSNNGRFFAFYTKQRHA